MMVSRAWVKEHLWVPVQEWALRFVCRFPVLSDFYYCVDRSFHREHRAVLMGRLAHRDSIARKEGDGAAATLRRSIHRIEKGLVMRPRRESFAVGYIEETVELFQSAVEEARRNGQTDGSLVRWGHDVLSEYFAVVTDAPVIAQARARFEQVDWKCGSTLPESTPSKPYRRGLRKSAIGYHALLNLSKQRRSVRWYQARRVPREIIDRAVVVAANAPSACNRQSFRFLVFDEPEVAARLGDIPGGTSGFSGNFPCFVIVVGSLRAYPRERDRHVIYIDGSLAVMSFQFALEVQGVGSCCINWPDLEVSEKRLRSVIDLDEDDRVIMCLSIGYPDPDGLIPFSQKKDLDEVRTYDSKVHLTGLSRICP